MGSGEQITTEALRTLADGLDAVKEALEAAGEKIESAEIAGSGFGKDGIAMGIAYPSAHDFGKRDADSKAAHIESIQERLRSTANVWDRAEDVNTVQPG